MKHTRWWHLKWTHWQHNCVLRIIAFSIKNLTQVCSSVEGVFFFFEQLLWWICNTRQVCNMEIQAACLILPPLFLHYMWINDFKSCPLPIICFGCFTFSLLNSYVIIIPPFASKNSVNVWVQTDIPPSLPKHPQPATLLISPIPDVYVWSPIAS